MIADSEFVGDWRGSAYLPDGVRIDYALSLKADGGYVWRTRYEDREEHCSWGTWDHDRAEQLLIFRHSESAQGYSPSRPQLWRVLQFPGLEGADTIMVLRWVALSSRNLPVQFYRVFPTTAEPGAAAGGGHDSGSS